ncbi:MAG: SDR family NAD(P)-dependent oxidoreductase [Lentisphaerae bacterium]|nr:SDR family NAD(P)-dependent oxidoreductase [Lentisphaerota bacterium]
MNIIYAEEFAGKVAIVTGASSGLGRHLATTLAGLGTEVFFCGRNVETGRETEKLCKDKGHFICCDLSKDGDVKKLVGEAVAFKGRIDYLVNNAATDQRIPFEKAVNEDFDRFIATNLKPCFTVSQCALPGLRKGQGKAIVNIGTTNYMLGLSPFTVYNASKAGILGFTRSLARELGPELIRVNMLSPGWIMTEKQLKLYVTENDKVQLLKDQCLPFLLTAEHVSPVILFLLSGMSAGITGQNLVVDGGKVMQ